MEASCLFPWWHVTQDEWLSNRAIGIIKNHPYWLSPAIPPALWSCNDCYYGAPALHTVYVALLPSNEIKNGPVIAFQLIGCLFLQATWCSQPGLFTYWLHYANTLRATMWSGHSRVFKIRMGYSVYRWTRTQVPLQLKMKRWSLLDKRARCVTEACGDDAGNGVTE